MDNPTIQEPNLTAPTSTGALTQVVKDKKKKKKKLTPKERALERLEKSCTILTNDSDQFNNLIFSVSYWLKSKEKIVYKLFHNQCLQSLDHEIFLETIKKKAEAEEESKKLKDTDEFQIEPTTENQVEPQEISTLSQVDFKISYDDFKLVTCDLDIPCTNVQLHLICKLLDPNNTGKIDYRLFTCEFLDSLIRRHHMDGIRFIKGTEQTKHLRHLTFKKELSKHFASSAPSYIKLDLKHVTFANEKDFRGHIKEEIVNTKTKIISLIEMLKERLDIASYKISLYQDVSKTKSSYLDESSTLENYGYSGVSYNEAVQSSDKVILFFDYWILRNDDPILNCDFYFNSYKLKK
ncbi:unnamed protein product [Brachionus calyciflorus]|uniref:EF-hand domain-containing protein n=1 Tax=Brachionus calyciflorus TaxID=104777 RepID=A0A813PQV6_9BILA|nr:unnamed protein product [Brachionus calyciflorus]